MCQGGGTFTVASQPFKMGSASTTSYHFLLRHSFLSSQTLPIIMVPVENVSKEIDVDGFSPLDIFLFY
jgi:hypothetical protein